MPRTEARVKARIWKDPDWTARTIDEQWLYELLISQNDLSHAGVIALRPTRWSRLAGAGSDGNSNLERVQRAIEGLTAKHFVVVDEDTGELLVRTLILNDEVYRQPNILKAAAASLDQIDSPVLRDSLRYELERISTLPDLKGESIGIVRKMLEILGNASPEPPANGFGNPSENPSANPSEDPSRNLLGERGGSKYYKYEDQDLPPVPTAPPPSGGAKSVTNGRAEIAQIEPPNSGTSGIAESIVRTWIASLPKKSPTSIVNAIGQHVAAAVRDGCDPNDIKTALEIWQQRRVGPNVLPSLIHEVANTAPAFRDPEPFHRPRSPELRLAASPVSTTDQRVAAGLALVEEFRAAEQRELAGKESA